MATKVLTTLICTGLGATTCACASMNDAGSAVATGGGPVYQGGATVYRTSSSMVSTTVGETYNGLGGAVRRPFQDFNMMQDKVPDSLEQALKNPYDTAGLSSCDKINAQVAMLDVALGPDLDTPKVESQQDRWHRGASSAADYALAAATGAADHFIPVRGVIREVSGANKADKHMRRAELAGSVRRGFLKAVGMQQGCGWPAAPVDFKPDVATVYERRHADAGATPAAAAATTAYGTAVAAAATSPVRPAATPDARPKDYARIEPALAGRGGPPPPPPPRAPPPPPPPRAAPARRDRCDRPSQADCGGRSGRGAPQRHDPDPGRLGVERGRRPAAGDGARCGRDVSEHGRPDVDAGSDRLYFAADEPTRYGGAGLSARDSVDDPRDQSGHSTVGRAGAGVDGLRRACGHAADRRAARRGGRACAGRPVGDPASPRRPDHRLLMG